MPSNDAQNVPNVQLMKSYRCKFFYHNRPVAFLIKQLVCTSSVLFPRIQSFHLINADGRSGKLFKIQFSVLKSAHLVPWQVQVSSCGLYSTNLIVEYKKVWRSLTVLTKSTTRESFIASVEFFTNACMFHLHFSNQVVWVTENCKWRLNHLQISNFARRCNHFCLDSIVQTAPLHRRVDLLSMSWPGPARRIEISNVCQ